MTPSGGPADERPSMGERILACVLTCGTFLLVYNLCNQVAHYHGRLGRAYFDWELLIPFVPLFVVPYWSIDLLFVGAPFVCSTRAALGEFTRRIVAAIGIAGLCFLLFPLRLMYHRPEVTGVLGSLFTALDNFNNYYNLAPSLHIALRTILWTVYIPAAGSGLLARGLEIWFFLIGLSTLLCWQHHVIDVFTGQLLGLVVLYAIDRRRPADAVVHPRHRNRELGHRYLLVAALCFLLTVGFWLPGVLLLWPTIGFGIIGLQYLRGDPWLFRKRGGRIPAGVRMLFAPYFAGLRLAFAKYRRALSTEIPIGRHLIIGRRPDPGEFERLGAEPTAIIDLAPEWDTPAAPDRMPYLHLSVPDFTLPSLDQLHEAAGFLREHRTGGKVFVHCSLGLLRSATTAAALLMASGEAASAADAAAAVRAAQPRAIFGSEALTLLENFGKELRHDE